MATYRRLTLMEREELSRMLAAGYNGGGPATRAEYGIAGTRSTPCVPRDLSGGAGSSPRPMVGASSTEAPQDCGYAPTPPSGLGPAGAPLVAGTDYPQLAPAVSSRPNDADFA